MSDSRSKLLLGAIDLLRTRGVGATSVRELAKHTGAPLGSTYHYFPEGKVQLVTEAVDLAGEHVSQTLAKVLNQYGTLGGIESFLKHWKKVLQASDFQAGCPVIAIAVESQSGAEFTPTLNSASSALTRWSELLADSLQAHGVSQSAARPLATAVLCALEGAILTCRIQRSTEALDQAGQVMLALLGNTIAECKRLSRPQGE